MRLVTIEEYDVLKPIIKQEMIALAKHENKNSYTTQIAINSCYVRNLNKDMQLYQIFSLGFLPVIEHDYLAALKDNSECFGTGNAKNVIHALYLQAQKHNWIWDEERYEEYLSNEIFCLLLCKKNGIFLRDRLLRIDLFRQIKESQKRPGCYDFIGGIFHALHHFSIGEQCASIFPNQNVLLYDVEQLIWPIAKAYYEGCWRNGKYPNTFETDTIYLEKNMTLEFYNEEDRHVSFVNSIIPKSIKL
jgi:hypothetical protein